MTTLDRIDSVGKLVLRYPTSFVIISIASGVAVLVMGLYNRGFIG